MGARPYRQILSVVLLMTAIGGLAAMSVVAQQNREPDPTKTRSEQSAEVVRTAATEADRCETEHLVLHIDKGLLAMDAEEEFCRTLERYFVLTAAYLGRQFASRMWKVTKPAYYLTNRAGISHVDSPHVFLFARRVIPSPAIAIHETVHLLLASKPDAPRMRDDLSPEEDARLWATAGDWLMEGFASHAASEIEAAHGIPPDRLFLKGDTSTVDDEARTWLSDPRGVRVLPFIGAQGAPDTLGTDRVNVAPPFYVLGQSFTKFLVERAGRRAVIRLYEEHFGGTQSIAADVKRVTGRDLVEWRAAWLATRLMAGDAHPSPRFTDLARVSKLESARPEIDRLFRSFAEQQQIPGMAWGMVIDDRVVHLATFGVRDRASQAPVTGDTAFRIASMTKSVTTLAVLKLRDEGKLSLDDPVSRFIPAFTRIERPTSDTPALTIRQLLSHQAGFPEDNPWGDRQLSVPDATLDAWLAKGIPFSTAPGTRYEYSNYGFALLGRIVAKASRMPYERYVRTAILSKLRMDSSTFEASTVPGERRAIGYRLEPGGRHVEEPSLPHGAFGSMGGLVTTARDLGKYVAFHLSAWPPRDGADAGPVRRASVREMAHPWAPVLLMTRLADGRPIAREMSYAFGLMTASDCRFDQIVSHGGGLPGFGSYMEWLPEYGVGMFAMANLTYAAPVSPMGQAWEALRATGGLRPRELSPTAAQIERRGQVLALWNRWDDDEAKRIAAPNLLLDVPAARRQADLEALKAEVGTCTDAGPLVPENWLRGQFNLTCERGTVGAHFTLAPTQPPTVQALEFRKLPTSDERMGDPPRVSCAP